MVYCDYKSNTADSVTYAYGGLTSDITGEVVFNFRDGSFDVEKEPTRSSVPIRHLVWMYQNHKNEFIQGIFRPKLSFESG